MLDIFNKKEINKLENEILNLKAKYSRESAKAIYWQCKFNFPDKEFNVFGTKEDIEYIKGNPMTR